MENQTISEISFTVNGVLHTVNKYEADTSLNSYLRNHLNLRGTKAMCHEGGCGACTVSVIVLHPVTKKPEIFAVNSCNVSILSCHGWEINTVEGIGNKIEGYHPVQKRLAAFNGTQCGYCSPGWVMNMYSLYETKVNNLTSKEIENSFGGNMCRCTGYRPILDAFKSFSKDADPKLIQQLKDIEELSDLKICEKNREICVKSCNDYSSENDCCVRKFDNKYEIKIAKSESKWYKVFSIDNIFSILKEEKTDSYMLVSGNTAQGVYHMDVLPKIMIDITSIAELRSYEINSHLLLGGNMTMSETIETFMKISKENDDFAYTSQFYKHIELIGHIPVRNVGTLAGNLMIKHNHNEFQSDLFVLLETVKAKLIIVENHAKYLEVTLEEFLKMNMVGRIIYRIKLSRISSQYVFHSYKIMPRAQNAHAHISAGFLLKFNDEMTAVEDANIVYAGINPNFIHAKQTEAFILGKNVFKNNVLNSTLNYLSKELHPNECPPEPSPEYRKKLAIGLFYKYILHICQPQLVDSSYKLGGNELERPISSGKQTFDINKEIWPVNKPMAKVEGLLQCAGEAPYMNDLLTQPNEVYAAFVLSTVHDGFIDKIDATEVLKMEGVITLLTAKDIPGVNSFGGNHEFVSKDEEVLCSNKVLYNGQPVAIIVAKTEKLANLTASKVKVTYKNSGKNPPVLTIRNAMASSDAEQRIIREATVEPTRKCNNVDKVIKGSLDIFEQYHYTMETQTCVCVPTEDGMDIYSSCQWMDLLCITVAQVLNMPVNSINMNMRRIGGGFGGKISRSIQIAVACAMTAKVLNRPARLVLSIESNMAAMSKRAPVSSDYEVGVDTFGKIQYLRNSFYSNCGCSLNENVALFIIEPFYNCYDSSTWFVEAHNVLTDTASNGWCRAPGTTEAVAMVETIMDHIAKETGNNPTDVRLINMTTENNPLPNLIEIIKESSDFTKRANDICSFNSHNKWRKRGISLIPLKFDVDYWGNLNSYVSIYHGDGTVAISTAGIELGQGLHTKVVQTCAYSLGIPMETIKIKPCSNLISANAIGTGGGVSSEICSFATMKACEILMKRLEPIKKQMDNPTWKELVSKAYELGINLCAEYRFIPGDTLKKYCVWGVSIIEVEVDVLTGNHLILRADILEDTGESFNPALDIGQVEGAYIMGIGYWTSEQLIYNKKTGALLTNRTWNYKPPGAKDIPVDFRIQFLHSAPSVRALRSKATGEPALNMAVGIVSALRQAITSVRTDNGLPSESWCHINMPCTVENILLAMNTDHNTFKLQK